MKVNFKDDYINEKGIYYEDNGYEDEDNIKWWNTVQRDKQGDEKEEKTDSTKENNRVIPKTTGQLILDRFF